MASNLNYFSVQAHMKPIEVMKYNREGDLIFTASKESSAAVFRANTGRLIGRYYTKGACMSLDMNSESTLLATASGDGRCIIFKVESGETLAIIDIGAPLKVVQFSHDDKILMVVGEAKIGNNSKIHFFHVPDELYNGPIKVAMNAFQVYTVQSKEEEITTACWGPTNDYIYFGDKTGVVGRIDVENNSEDFTVERHRGPVNRIVFDPWYMTLVSCGVDHDAHLLDSRKLTKIRTYSLQYPIRTASVSPIADHVLLAGGVDAQDVTTSTTHGFNLHFFHKVHGELLTALDGIHFGTINAVAFSPSGRGFASAAVDGFLNIFPEMPESYFSSPGSAMLWKPEEEKEDVEEEEEEYAEEEQQEQEDEDAPEADMDFDQDAAEEGEEGEYEGEGEEVEADAEEENAEIDNI